MADFPAWAGDKPEPTNSEPAAADRPQQHGGSRLQPPGVSAATSLTAEKNMAKVEALRQKLEVYNAAIADAIGVSSATSSAAPGSGRQENGGSSGSRRGASPAAHIPPPPEVMRSLRSELSAAALRDLGVPADASAEQSAAARRSTSWSPASPTAHAGSKSPTLTQVDITIPYAEDGSIMTEGSAINTSVGMETDTEPPEDSGYDDDDDALADDEAIQPSTNASVDVSTDIDFAEPPAAPRSRSVEVTTEDEEFATETTDNIDSEVEEDEEAEHEEEGDAAEESGNDSVDTDKASPPPVVEDETDSDGEGMTMKEATQNDSLVEDAERAVQRLQAALTSADNFRRLIAKPLQPERMPYGERLAFLEEQQTALFESQPLNLAGSMDGIARARPVPETAADRAGELDGLVAGMEKALNSFEVVHERRAAVEAKDKKLKERAQQMQELYKTLDERRRLLTRREADIAATRANVRRRRAAVEEQQKRDEEQEAAIAKRETHQKEREAHFMHWMKILESREQQLTQKEARLRSQQEALLQDRLALKENLLSSSAQARPSSHAASAAAAAKQCGVRPQGASAHQEANHPARNNRTFHYRVSGLDHESIIRDEESDDGNDNTTDSSTSLSPGYDFTYEPGTNRQRSGRASHADTLAANRAKLFSPPKREFGKAGFVDPNSSQDIPMFATGSQMELEELERSGSLHNSPEKSSPHSAF